MPDLARLSVDIGVTGADKTVNDVRKVSSETAKAGASMAASLTSAEKGVSALQEKIIRSMQAVDAAMKSIGSAGGANTAGMQQVSAALREIDVAMKSLTPSTKAMNDNVKLASHQLLNLSRQGNDVITMLALGASPMQVFASQAGQIYDALASGEGGLRGGLNAAKNSLKDFLSGFSRVGLIFGGVAGAAIAAGTAFLYFTDKTEANFKKLEGAAKSYKDTIAEVTRGQKELAAAADAVFSKSTTPTGAQAAARIQAELETQRRAAQAARDQATTTAMGAVGPFDIAEILRNTGRIMRGEDSSRTLYRLAKDFQDGKLAAAEFGMKLDELAAKTDLPENLRQTQEELRALATAGVEAKARIEALTGSLMQMERARAAASRNRYDDARSDLQKFIPDTTTDREQVQRAYLVELGRIKQLRGVKGDEREELEAGAVRQRTDALKELDRVEKSRRDGYALDIKGLTARTASEKAALAAERARVDAAADPKLRNDRDKINQLAQEASDRSMAESRAQLAEATRQQSIATADQVTQMQEELQLVGKSAGETARLRAEFEMLAQAKEAARSAGFDADTVALTEEMKKQAAQVGELSAAMEKLNFERDIAFRMAQAGRSEQDQRIGQQLYSAGIDFDSAEGQRRAGIIRTAEAAEKAGDAMRDLQKATKDTFADLVDAVGRGDKAFDALISSFAQLGQKLANAGFDRLFGDLFDGSKSAAAQATKIATVQASLGSYVSPFSGGVGSDYASLQPTSTVRSASRSAALASSPAVAVWQFFESKGLSKVAISGIMGNAYAESAFNYRNNSGDGGKAHGLFQWNDRAGALMDFTKGDWQDLGKQLEFAWHELSTTERGTLDKLKQATTVSEATQAFLGFERPQGYSASDPTRSHNYAGRVGAAQAAYDQYAGELSSKVVSDGVIDANRKMATGAVPIPTQRPTTAEGGVNINPAGGLFGNMTGKQALQGVTGLVGIAANGYQSGSAFGGALGGALSGAQLGSMIPGVGTAIGAVVGTIVGGISGLFGKGAQKKAANKAKWAQAEEAWKQNLPAFNKLEDEVTRTERGPLSAKIKELSETLQQFDDLAKKGKGDRNNDQIRRVRAELADYVAFLSDNFIRDLPTVIADLGKGQGLDTGFTKARDNVMQMADSYRGFMKDITDAYAIPVDQKAKILSDFEAAKALAGEQKKKIEEIRMDGKGNPYRATKWETIKKDDPAALAAATATRDDALAAFDAKYGDAVQRMNEQLEAARKAAVEGLLRIVSGDIPEQSDIQKAIQEAAGAASGLRTALVDLGLSADETAAAIDKALGQRMAKMRTDFEDSIRGEINDIDGKGYLNSVKDLLKTRDTMMADAQRLGADGNLVASYFGKSAQEIVDGAELTGSAFDDLVKAFPELASVVHAFVDETTRSAEAIAQRVKDYKDRYFSATTDTSTLAGAMSAFDRGAARDREEEMKAGGGAMLSLEAALAAEKAQTIKNLLVSAYQSEQSEIEATRDRLQGLSDEWKDLRKNLKLDNNLSTLNPYDQFLEAQKDFRDIRAKAMAGDEDAQGKLAGASQSYLEEAKAYYASSEDYYNAFNEVQGTLENSETLADKQLDAAKKQLDVLKAQLETLTGVKDGVAALAAAYAAASEAAKAAAGKAGLTPSGTTPVGTAPNVGSNSVRYLANNADVAAAIAAGNTFGLAKGFAPEVYASAHYGLFGQAEGRAWQKGGLIPGYVKGGMIGNGIWNKDSVIARYADGGPIALAGGEYVVRAPMVNPRTLPALEAMNRGYMPANGNGNAEVAAELRRIAAKLDSLRATTADGAVANVAATKEVASAQQAMAQAARRAAAA